MKKLQQIELDILSQKEVIETLKNSLYNLESINFSDRTQGGNINYDNGITEKIYKIEKLEKELNKMIYLKFKYIEKINLVTDPVFKAILRYRYILNFSWDEIANKIGYSQAQTFRLHKKALKELKYDSK